MEKTGGLDWNSCIFHPTQTCLYLLPLWPPSLLARRGCLPLPTPRDNSSPDALSPMPVILSRPGLLCHLASLGQRSCQHPCMLEFSYLKYLPPLPTASHVLSFLCSLNSQLLEKVVHASPTQPLFQPPTQLPAHLVSGPTSSLTGLRSGPPAATMAPSPRPLLSSA